MPSLEQRMGFIQLKHKNMYEAIGILEEAIHKIKVAENLIRKWNAIEEQTIPFMEAAVSALSATQEALNKEYFQ